MPDSYDVINDAITNHVNNSDIRGSIVTGWVVVMSISGSEDGYMVVPSDGLPYHTQLGLLEVASNDARNAGFISMMTSSFYDFWAEFNGDGGD